MEYANEAKLADTLTLTREQAEDAVFLSGETDRKIFRMRLVYEYVNTQHKGERSWHI